VSFIPFSFYRFLLLSFFLVREISAFIAKEVIRAAQKANVDRSTQLRSMNDDELLTLINQKMWNPSI
jgi:malate dehydrogenase (oxaloacetate-decarboxylating)(NADP+)